ncbi:MAG: hypothetical protein WD038_09890 [Balneolales bacterium]
MAWLYILLLALVLQLFMPWWSVALASVILGAGLGQKSTHAFLAGFYGIGLLWLSASSYIHFANDGILSGRVATMMGLPNAFSIILVTVLVGAMVGGLASLTGFLLKDLLITKQIATPSTTR